MCYLKFIGILYIYLFANMQSLSVCNKTGFRMGVGSWVLGGGHINDWQDRLNATIRVEGAAQAEYIHGLELNIGVCLLSFIKHI